MCVFKKVEAPPEQENAGLGAGGLILGSFRAFDPEVSFLKIDPNIITLILCVYFFLDSHQEVVYLRTASVIIESRNASTD